MDIRKHVFNSATDIDFDKIYPSKLRHLSAMHWTPLAVAHIAAKFLVAKPGAKILDIGSGVGKFCFVGAMTTTGHFTGVEQRGAFVQIAKTLAKEGNVSNLTFIHDNILSTDFSAFDGFYYFNPFGEHIDVNNRIEDGLTFDPLNYEKYSAFVLKQLSKCQTGTGLATMNTPLIGIPSSYQLQDDAYGGLLKLWKKVE